MINETITISLREYQELEKRSELLSCLEEIGVDNWEGYGEARRLMGDSDDEEESYEDIYGTK